MASARTEPCEFCDTPFSARARWCPNCRLARGEPVRHIFTKAAGVSFEGRQGVLDGMARHERGVLGLGKHPLPWLVPLKHQPKNEYDPNAVAVYAPDGRQFGFLQAELAEEVVEAWRVGRSVVCLLANLTGGNRNTPTHGANLLLVLSGPHVSSAIAHQYVVNGDLAGGDVPLFPETATERAVRKKARRDAQVEAARAVGKGVADGAKAAGKAFLQALRDPKEVAREKRFGKKPPEVQPVDTSRMAFCEHCGEEVQWIATRCRHCGKRLPKRK